MVIFQNLHDFSRSSEPEFTFKTRFQTAAPSSFPFRRISFYPQAGSFFPTVFLMHPAVVPFDYIFLHISIFIFQIDLAIFKLEVDHHDSPMITKIVPCSPYLKISTYFFSFSNSHYHLVTPSEYTASGVLFLSSVS